jgi:hypothetical protein
MRFLKESNKIWHWKVSDFCHLVHEQLCVIELKASARIARERPLQASSCIWAMHILAIRVHLWMYRKIWFRIVPRPASSPDLTSNHFFLFRNLKRKFVGLAVESKEELIWRSRTYSMRFRKRHSFLFIFRGKRDWHGWSRTRGVLSLVAQKESLTWRGYPEKVILRTFWPSRPWFFCSMEDLNWHFVRFFRPYARESRLITETKSWIFSLSTERKYRHCFPEMSSSANVPNSMHSMKGFCPIATKAHVCSGREK